MQPRGTPDEPAAGDRIGPYLIERRLGEGAAGVVFRAVREADGAVVALKVLRPEIAGNETARRRFAQEARAAAEVEHPHLVPLLDAGEADGRPWLAARYVDGASLAVRLGAGPLGVDELLRLIGEVAAGLQALHEHGLVHRDVKPSNILLDQDGRALLCDFGLAKGIEYSVLTRPGQVLGTLLYMAPELIAGRPATPASDVYSLGCVAFECLAGRPPFSGHGMLQLGVAHLQQEPADPGAGRPEVPAGLGWAVRQALAKEPRDRPSTALALAHMLHTAARSG